MYIPDYDKALYHTLWGEWDELLLLMVRTKDDLLAKKIQIFLHAFHYSTNEHLVLKHHDNLLYYVDHAMKMEPSETLEV